MILVVTIHFLFHSRQANKSFYLIHGSIVFLLIYSHNKLTIQLYNIPELYSNNKHTARNMGHLVNIKFMHNCLLVYLVNRRNFRSIQIIFF